MHGHGLLLTQPHAHMAMRACCAAHVEEEVTHRYAAASHCMHHHRPRYLSSWSHDACMGFCSITQPHAHIAMPFTTVLLLLAIGTIELNQDR